MSAWTPSVTQPYTYTFKTATSIATSHYPDLTRSLSSALLSYETATNSREIASLSRIVRGAEASLAVISAENQLASATVASVQARASDVIINATYNLQALAEERDFYGYDLNSGGNGFFFAFSVLLCLFFIAMLFRAKYQWFNVCFGCGFAFEALGFLGRLLAINDRSSLGFFVLQGFRLNMAPAFVKAGLYFVLAQMIVVYGRQYSRLKPLWYPYIFLSLDIISLLFQGVGETLAPSMFPAGSNHFLGRVLMFVGLLIEVLAIGMFFLFCLWISYLTSFKDRFLISEESGFKTVTPSNILKMLLNTSSAKRHKVHQLDRFYDTNHQGVRSRPLFHYLPLIISIAALLLFVRCAFRIAKVRQGYSGYFITHEMYLFVFDSTLITAVGLLFVVFHPVFVFGKENVLRVGDMHLNRDTFTEKPHSPGIFRVNSEETFDSRAVQPTAGTRQGQPETIYIY